MREEAPFQEERRRTSKRVKEKAEAGYHCVSFSSLPRAGSDGGSGSLVDTLWPLGLPHSSDSELLPGTCQQGSGGHLLSLFFAALKIYISGDLRVKNREAPTCIRRRQGSAFSFKAAQSSWHIS